LFVGITKLSFVLLVTFKIYKNITFDAPPKKYRKRGYINKKATQHNKASGDKNNDY